jgi:starch synthase
LLNKGIALTHPAPPGCTPGRNRSSGHHPARRNVAAFSRQELILPLHVLLVAAEAFPLAKTGGLGDMVSAYASALREAGAEATILMPGYPRALADAKGLVRIATLAGLPGGSAHLLRGRMPDSDVPVVLLQMDQLYARDGLYQDAHGVDYADNATRFAALSAAAVRIAQGVPGLALPDVVHAHDWHAGLTPLLMKLAGVATPSVYTIHNLAFQGNYPLALGRDLGVPDALLAPAMSAPDSIEFYGDLSLMKAGILYADRVTAVSEAYSREILTARFGQRMEGVLQTCTAKLSGITNGIDQELWNPATDRLIARNYSAADVRGKHACKRDLQRMFGLPADPFVPLVAVGSRLTTQKMADVVAVSIDQLLEQHARLQIVVLGKGDAAIEAAITRVAHRWPNRIGIFIGYDERRAHLLHAGADILLHASRFEPCGLTQIYAMRYGTVPVASRVGGLSDTIVDLADALRRGPGDANDEACGTVRPATGFLFPGDAPCDVVHAVSRALDTFMRPTAWRTLQRNAMLGDHSWTRSVARYLDLYAELTQARPLSDSIPLSESIRVRRVRPVVAAAALMPAPVKNPAFTGSETLAPLAKKSA